MSIFQKGGYMKRQRIVIIVCLVLAAIVGIIGMIMTGRLERRIAELYVSMEENNVEMTTEVEQEVTDKKPEVFLAEAEKLGNELADVEKTLIDVVYDGMDILEEEAFKENVEQQKELFGQIKSYFRDDASYLEVWYTADKTAVNPKWEFCKNYMYSTSFVGCMWICRDLNNNGILAYVLSTYDVNAGKFKSMELHTTFYGYKGYAVTLEQGEQIDRSEQDMSEFASGILDLADNNKSVEVHEELTDEQKEQMANIYMQREKMREEYEKNGGQ